MQLPSVTVRLVLLAPSAQHTAMIQLASLAPRVCTLVLFDFTSTGAWDVHINNVLDNGRRKLHSVIISNRDINLSARWLLLLAVVRPTLE